MPELAEVDYYRKQWDCGLGQKIVSIQIHADKRIFRSADTAALTREIPGSKLLASESSGKQMLFRFSKDIWLGLHLGMTGKLFVGPAAYAPEKHDHFVLGQKSRSLVFSDMRQFGRVQFHQGKEPPAWWVELSAAISSEHFTFGQMTAFLESHRKMLIKPALLLQKGFPGVGNWMADEILWRAKLSPLAGAGKLSDPERKRLWREVRAVCRIALEKVGADFSDPPAKWLYHQRWKKGGICPIHKTPLSRATIGGRTTAWCPQCQG